MVAFVGAVHFAVQPIKQKKEGSEYEIAASPASPSVRPVRAVKKW